MDLTRPTARTDPAVPSWPSQEQTLLLRACLLDRDPALEAWSEWSSTVDVERLDEGSSRLLPLLYRNLHSFGLQDPVLQRFKGVYRLTWYKNHLLFHHLARMVRAFGQEGIETMVLKGAALTVLHYRDYGVRPMNDLDLLVKTDKVSAALRVLKENQWSSRYPLPATISNALLSVRHAHPFIDGQGRELDLHWHVLYECCEPNADADFWSAAVRAEIEDTPVFVLNPTDQLLHACVHGAGGNLLSPLRWVADAMIILKTSAIDWERLLAQAQNRHLALQMTDTLRYLQDEMGVPLPGQVLKRLAELPISVSERIDYRFSTRPWNVRGVTDLVWFHYRHSSKWARSTGSHRVLGLPRYFQAAWVTDRPSQIPLQMIRRTLRRLWKVKFLRAPVEHTG